MKYQKNRFFKFNPLAISILISLPAVVHADVQIQNGSLNKVNNVTVVDISKPNSNGISHNIYDKLDVDKEGLIFNNSQNGANTILAGQIAGNANLASGSAKVIINEVTSKNKSTLNGYMEVGGDKAYLIISNPNGITCTSCGFINTNGTTLTTGKVDIQNNELKGYSVNGGKIEITDLNTDSPTAILTRSAVISGNIYSKEIAVVTGNNYVNTNNEVTSTVTASGTRNTYSIDVAKLGGMYASKISLVSTESGVGVRNLGTIATGSNGIQLDVNGRLINSNASLKSTGDINIKLAGNIDNVTGEIATEGSININTNNNDINNSRAGNILASKNVTINSGAFNNTNGKISSGETFSLNTNNKTLTNSGKGSTVGIEAKNVVLETGTFNNSNGQISANSLSAKSTSVNNNKGSINTMENLKITTDGSLNNTRGLIRTANGNINIAVNNGTITNSYTKTADTASGDSLGIIAGDGGINLSATTIDNSRGQIASSNNIEIAAAQTINNSSGKAVATKNIKMSANSLNNSQAGISSEEGNITLTISDTITNSLGVIQAKGGESTLIAKNFNNNTGLLASNDINIIVTNNVNNETGFIAALNDLKITAGGTVYNQDARDFGDYGFYLGMGEQDGGIVAKGSLEISAQNVNSNNSRIVAENGSSTLKVKNSFSNSRGLLSSGTATNVIAKSVNNNYATISSGGDLLIDAETLSLYSSGNIIDNNATGIISSGNDLTLNLSSRNTYNNYGWISGKNSVSLSTAGALNNTNTIYSSKDLKITTSGNISNSKDIVGNSSINVNASGSISNSGNLFSEGTATIKATAIRNTSGAVLGGRSGLDVGSVTVTGTGKIIGEKLY